MAAKYLRCSVAAAMKLADSDIECAVIAARGNNALRQFMQEHPKKR